MEFSLKNETKLAIEAVMEGERICNLSYSPEIVNVKESLRDISTIVDMEIEQSIISILSESKYPILAEETSHNIKTNIDTKKLYWAVDPIDGTVNFINGLDIFCVSVGLCKDNDFLLGAIAMPRLRKLYCTIGPDAAFLNGKPLIHNHRKIEEALIAASFSGEKSDIETRNNEYQLFGDINDLSRGCVRLGSAAANICFTASGELQAAYGFNAKIWDVAGALSVAITAGCSSFINISKESNNISYIVGSETIVSKIHQMSLEKGFFTV